MRQNRLAQDIHGIGFISADKIASHLGIAKDTIIRARAGITYVLLEATSDGNCALPLEELLKSLIKLLEIDESIISLAINEEINDGSITKDTINDSKGNIEAIFLTSYYIYEKYIAEVLRNISMSKVPWDPIDTKAAIPWAENKLNIILADAQKAAIDKVVDNKVMVITGGPGTGKTTLVNSILTILTARKLNIKLCAPTGRAAKRLSESTKIEAFTIHRLLEFDPSKGSLSIMKKTTLHVII